MQPWISSAVVGASLIFAMMTPASSLPQQPSQPALSDSGSIVIPVAQGCGPGRWRGPWGGCRATPYVGPMPGGGYAYPSGGYGYFGNGCPPGYWHGPWGHCRNTPYHGRLPNGGWK